MENNKTPSIRFKGFTDPWEQRKLEELSSSFEDTDAMQQLKNMMDWNKQIYKNLQILMMIAENLKQQNTSVTSPDNFIVKTTNYLKGDILFARTGANVGKTYIYKASDGLVYYAGFLIRARIKPEYNSEFVFQNTLTGDYEKFIKVTSMRAGRNRVLKLDEMLNYEVIFPSKEEQSQIGEYFDSLDHLITLHQRELEKLQNIKKSMLEKMFV